MAVLGICSGQGYWENGAASSARETAINRNAAERLVHSSLFEISSKKVIVTSIQPIEDCKAFIIRLYNSGESPEEVNIKWGNLNPDKVYLSSPYKIKGKEIKGAFNMAGFGIRTILVEI